MGRTGRAPLGCTPCAGGGTPGQSAGWSLRNVPVGMGKHSPKITKSFSQRQRVSDRLLERLGLGVVRIDRELRIISLGNAARRILKLPEEDLRGRSLREVLPEPLFKEVYSAVRRYLRQD